MSIRDDYEKETGRKAYYTDSMVFGLEYIAWLESRVEGKGINGTLLMVGTMKIDGEELTGCFVECSRETLQNYPVSILYKNCTIPPVRGINEND